MNLKNFSTITVLKFFRQNLTSRLGFTFPLGFALMIFTASNFLALNGQNLEAPNSPKSATETTPLVEARTEEPLSEAPPLVAAEAQTEELLTEAIEKITYTKPKLVKNVDFLLSLTSGIGGQIDNNNNTFRAEISTRRPSNTPAEANDTYEAIYGSTTIPYFISADIHAYYKWFGGGVSYHRINYTSRTQFSGVNIATSSDPDVLAERTTNAPVWSFNNYAHTYAYEYSLASDAYSLEFHLRRDFINKKVKILYGIGYLYQNALFRYELTSVDQNNTRVKQVDTRLTSHGFLMRLEMNFTVNYFLVRTGLLIYNNNFPTPTIEGIPLDVPRFLVAPYISMGVGF